MLEAATELGLRIPHDLSLVGFDDHEMAPAGDLTTIAQPVRRQGELAACRLLDVLAGREPDEPVDLELPTRLVVRGTTGPPVAVRADSAFA